MKLDLSQISKALNVSTPGQLGITIPVTMGSVQSKINLTLPLPTGTEQTAAAMIGALQPSLTAGHISLEGLLFSVLAVFA